MLGDHATHANAKYVGFMDALGIHKARSIGGHLFNGIGLI